MWTPPLRPLTRSTSAGFECIDFAQDVLGIDLFPWQRWLLVHALELLPDGSYRFRTVVLLVARQNGKSTLMQVLSLWRIYVDGAPLVIGTAQNLDVAEEQWQGAVEMAESVPELAAEIENVDRTNGKKALRLTTGERYKVAAASRRGGRGLSGDLVLLDELREHQKWDAWGAVTKTTMARALAQVWAASNAGDRYSVVLGFLRTAAHMALGNPDKLPTPPSTPDELGEEDEDSLGIFEWSAVPGCDKWDRDGWAQANPSLGFGIPERAIASAARTDPDEVFRTEVLCQWVDELEQVEQVIPADKWAGCFDVVDRSDRIAYAVDASPDGKAASIGVSDGSSILVAEHDFGLSWVPGRLMSLLVDRPGPVFVDPRGPAGALLVDLAEAAIEVTSVSPQEHAQACGGLLSAITHDGPDLRLHHSDQPILNAAVAGATRRPYGDSWAWNRRSATVDISPLVAVTLARWGALTMPAPFEGPLVAVT